MQNFVILALYKFTTINDCEKLQCNLLKLCKQNKVKGTVLVASEGINGSISGTEIAIDCIINYLESVEKIKNIEFKKSYAKIDPFLRMKVKIKKEIVTIGIPDVNPNKIVGKYVEPEHWNELIDNPDVVVIDTRNTYEYEIGTFKDSVNPKTKNFRDFPKYIDKNLDSDKSKTIAMFCTGGIRCEKASSYMLSKGFKDVYQLKGGILNYLKKTDPQKSHWHGECFVFDNRVAVNDELSVGSYDQCYGCRHPITECEKNSDKYVKGVCCPKCFDKTSTEQKKRFKDRQYQVELAKQKGIKHIGR